MSDRMWDRLERFLARSDRRTRFLAAYEQERCISRAAEIAGIHRATVHRWLAADPGFRDELWAAWQKGHKKWLETEYAAQQEQRRAAREQRLAELRPARQAQAAAARAARKR